MKTKSPRLSALLLFIIIGLKVYGIAIISSYEFVSDSFLNNHLTKIVVNGMISVGLMVVMFKSHFKNKIGILGSTKLQFVGITIPLFYAVIINLLNFKFIGEINAIYFTVFCLSMLSVGFVEEFSFRGLIQNYLIDHFGNSKKGIIKAVVFMSLFFASLHLLNFDKGVWGELTQFCYAFFIGMAFGVVFCLTQRIYALVVIHGLIDISSGID